MNLVLSSCFLPREKHNDLLRTLLESRTKSAEAGVTGQTGGAGLVSVFLTGIMPRPVAIVDMLQEVGVRVLGDDMGLGSLYYSIDVPDCKDPVKSLAEGYSSYPACSTLHNRALDRAATLVQHVQAAGAEGVLILATKFCEPEFFDYPDLKDDLEKAGIPALLLETELGIGVPGPIRTRVEAFVETLQQKET